MEDKEKIVKDPDDKKQDCPDCPHAKDSTETKEEILPVSLDLSEEIKTLKEEVLGSVKETLSNSLKEFKEEAKNSIREALKTKLVVGNLKAPKKEVKEEKNEFLDLMINTI